MKPLRALLLLTACACFCAAQEPAVTRPDGPPGLAVVKLKWERRLDVSRGGSRPAQDVSRAASDPDALNNPGGLPTAARGPFPPYLYVYSVEVRNDGAKRIRWVSWAYVLAEPGGRRELGRHEFASVEKIDPGKRKRLSGRTRSAPSRVVSADALAKGKAAARVERVEFRCVAYDDGTWWHGPLTSESECAEAEKRAKSR
jgi:hypothetical protein